MPSLADAKPRDPAARVSRAYREGTMVLETAFETADGSVALIDFMPIGQANSFVIRLVEGRRGRSAALADVVASPKQNGYMETHCVADDAVHREPVSAPNSLANREINREFC